MRYLLFSFVLGCVCLFAQTSSKPGPNPKISAGSITTVPPEKLSNAEAPSRSIPVKEAGDQVYFDPSNAQVVVRSRGRVAKLTMRNGADASITSTYTRSGEYLRYVFTIRNAPEARQGIKYFMFDTDADFANIDESAVYQADAPAGWSVMPGRLNEHSRFAAFKRPSEVQSRSDYDNDAKHLQNQLSPGQSAGPFILDSIFLPGLLSVKVSGFKPDPKQGEPSEEETFISEVDKASPWAGQQLAQWNTDNNNGFGRTLVIGPKLAPGTKVDEEVRAELRSAATFPEFREVAVRLMEISREQNAAEFIPELRELEKGQTGIRKEFIDALIYDLQVQ